MNQPEKALTWWWLSFVGKEDGFRGVVIVKGFSIESAIREAWRLEINPGGEVSAFPMPDEDGQTNPEVEALGTERLITLEDLRDKGYLKVGEWKEFLKGEPN